MIMVIGGRCQGKSSFAKEHFENRVQEKGKLRKIIRKIQRQITGQMGVNIHLGKNFLLPPGAGIFTCWYAGF